MLLWNDHNTIETLAYKFWWRAGELARLFGWQPAGTLPPPPERLQFWRREIEHDETAPWDPGCYSVDVGQVMTAADAAALAEALERALPNLPDFDCVSEKCKAGQTVSLIEFFSHPAIKCQLLRLIAFLRAGGDVRLGVLDFSQISLYHTGNPRRRPPVEPGQPLPAGVGLEELRRNYALDRCLVDQVPPGACLPPPEDAEFDGNANCLRWGDGDWTIKYGYNGLLRFCHASRGVYALDLGGLPEGGRFRQWFSPAARCSCCTWAGCPLRHEGQPLACLQRVAWPVGPAAELSKPEVK